MKISRTRKDISKLKDKTHIEDVNDLIDNIKNIKNVMNLEDSEIESLLNRGFTFSEILAGKFNDNGIFIPEEIIMNQTKEYLLQSNKFNTYAEH